MFLVFDVQMVENLFLLDFGGVGVGVFALESRLPRVDFAFFVLEESDEIFVFVDEMGVLAEEDFDLFFELFDFE